jgi:hypothetical protein
VRLIWGRVPGRRIVRAGPGPRLPTRRLDPWRTSADRHARLHDAGPLTFLAVLARQSLRSSFPWTGCGGSTRWRNPRRRRPGRRDIAAYRTDAPHTGCASSSTCLLWEVVLGTAVPTGAV